MKELSLKERIAVRLNEDHLTGKDDMIKFILANCKDYKKSELEDMEDKEIKKIYLDCEKECKGSKCNESHLKTREEQEKFIIDNDDKYNRKKLKDLTDKEVEKIYIKIEKECSVMEGKKPKLFNRFGTIKKILDKSDKYDREDLMKKSNDDIESIYKSLNEGKKEEDDDVVVNHMESPEHFVESWYNGQKSQCAKILDNILTSDKHDVDDLIDYLNSENHYNVKSMKDFIIKTLVKKINSGKVNENKSELKNDIKYLILSGEGDSKHEYQFVMSTKSLIEANEEFDDFKTGDFKNTYLYIYKGEKIREE